MKPAALFRALGGAALLISVSGYAGAQPTLELPKVTVYSDQVANQTPVATFAMPVSGLVFEPQVDVQARNFAEAQADVSIRGGIFENTGFRVGALGLFDPQTGHYFAELPIAPAMLGSPRILTGVDNAIAGFNASVGTAAYGWSPITTRGELALAAGEFRTDRQSFYQGWAHPLAPGVTLGADVELSHSESDGSVPFGDHQFKRIAGRVQRRSATGQTDFFAGWQKKFFGWPNLYTPFGFNESEDLETELFVFNHRHAVDAANFWEVGASYRRNDDDYEFNRAVPGASNPFQHVTHVRTVAADGRVGDDTFGVRYDAQWSRDAIRSTSLTFGRFNSRDYVHASVTPEFAGDASAGHWTLRGGASFDDTNRDDSALSPLVEGTLRVSARQTWRISYSEATQVPTYTALNSNATAGLFRGNPNLGRETSRNLELGFSGQVANWELRTALFRRWDDKLVDWTFRNGVVARTANAVDIATDGWELIATRKLGAVDLVLGYTWLRKEADYGAATIDASFYALNFARHRFTAALVARVGGGWEIRSDNEYRVQEKNPLRVIGGNEALLSALGVYYLPPAWRGLELSVRVDNLWDADFQEVPSVPAARRQLVFGAAYHW